MNIGKTIKCIRKIKGFSQEELAESASLSPCSISRAELNQQTLRFTTIGRISEALGITTAALVVIAAGEREAKDINQKIIDHVSEALVGL